jgi:hypothetical protein
MKKALQVLGSLYRADYNVRNQSQIMLEHPFTYIGLAMMEKCKESIHDKEIELEHLNESFYAHITPKMCEELALMISPTRETIYHIICKSEVMSKFFLEKLNIGRDEKFAVPFIQDMIGNTPLHRVVED